MPRVAPNLLPSTLVLFVLCCGADPESAPDVIASDDGPPTAGEDGAPCLTPTDCFGGVCLTEFEHGYTGGYCTSFDCEESPCHGGTCVIQESGNTACLDSCVDSSNCRTGFDCVEFGSIRICDLIGDPGVEVGTSPGGQCQSGCTAGDPVTIDCGFTPSRLVDDGSTTTDPTYQWGLPYQLTSGVDGFALSVWAGDEISRVNILSVRNQLDQYLDLKGADSALNVTSFVDNDFAVITLPFAPRLADFVSGGDGLLQVQSSAETLCIARSEGRGGHELEVDVYLVGASNLNTDSIGLDPDFAIVYAEMQRLLGMASIEIKRFVAHEVDPDIVDEYRIIRETDEMRTLFALTEDPTVGDDPTRRHSLSLNLILVDDIALSDGTETIGMAGLLPGPPGIHETRYSGVIVSTSSLRESPEYLALIIIHETAHYLGLRHTTELFDDVFAFGRVDPLDDTPTCPSVLDIMSDCPDYENLMFPLAPTLRHSDELELTNDQGWVLRTSPLVR